MIIKFILAFFTLVPDFSVGYQAVSEGGKLATVDNATVGKKQVVAHRVRDKMRDGPRNVGDEVLARFGDVHWEPGTIVAKNFKEHKLDSITYDYGIKFKGYPKWDALGKNEGVDVRDPVAEIDVRSFSKIDSGDTCEDNGMETITDKRECNAAAKQLMGHTSAASETGDTDSPSGCFLRIMRNRRGYLYLKSEPSNIPSTDIKQVFCKFDYRNLQISPQHGGGEPNIPCDSLTRIGCSTCLSFGGRKGNPCVWRGLNGPCQIDQPDPGLTPGGTIIRQESDCPGFRSPLAGSEYKINQDRVQGNPVTQSHAVFPNTPAWNDPRTRCCVRDRTMIGDQILAFMRENRKSTPINLKLSAQDFVRKVDADPCSNFNKVGRILGKKRAIVYDKCTSILYGFNADNGLGSYMSLAKELEVQAWETYNYFRFGQSQAGAATIFTQMASTIFFNVDGLNFYDATNPNGIPDDNDGSRNIMEKLTLKYCKCQHDAPRSFTCKELIDVINRFNSEEQIDEEDKFKFVVFHKKKTHTHYFQKTHSQEKNAYTENAYNSLFGKLNKLNVVFYEIKSAIDIKCPGEQL